MPYSIAIIGAGPAGCTLARLLQRSDLNITVTIFESESSIDFRSQGGTLDLHGKTGQAALKAAGLYEEFLKHCRFDGEAMKLADKKFLCYLNHGASKGNSVTGRPEIDRPRLRELLYNGLAEGSVVWGHKLVRVGDDLSLHFSNNKVHKGFDLVVGADGAWSKVRPRVTDVQPYYSGIAGHAFNIADAERRVPKLFEMVNRGSMFSWSDSKTIMAQYMGDGSINIGTWALRPQNWQKESGYDIHDLEAVKAQCRKEYADWDPNLVAFTQEADSAVPRDLYMLPIGNRWDHVPGVTLIGDAAHLMTPFAGEGVNLAMEDSMKLAATIIAAAKTTGGKLALDTHVAEFELDMFKRAKATQEMTYDMMYAVFHVKGSPRVGIEKYLLRAVQDELGYWVTKLIATPLVYTYFFFFKMLW